MGEPKRHHYVPEFYLTAWTDDDGRISIFQHFGGRIHRSRHTPKHTGFEYHLYSYSPAFSAKNRAEIEKNIFKRLDDVGALIVRKIIAGEDISDKERILWTQFVLSMRVRTPDNVAKIKAAGSEYLVRNLDMPNGKAPAEPGLLTSLRAMKGVQPANFHLRREADSCQLASPLKGQRSQVMGVIPARTVTSYGEGLNIAFMANPRSPGTCARALEMVGALLLRKALFATARHPNPIPKNP